MNKKLMIGLGLAAVATAVIAIGVVHELKKIRALTTDPDELPDAFDDDDEDDD